MNLASALIYRVLEEEDFETWTNVRKHYLPDEYQSLYSVIDKHTENFHKLPTLDELKLEVRDSATLDKVYALETIETEAEASTLLEYLKNEYAQREALFQLDKWVDQSIAFETAEEVVRHIQQIGVELESKVELVPAEETMQRINLFESDEDMSQRITLGLNEDFDSRFQFLPTDYIMLGGMRGSGKSLLCSNVAHNVVVKQQKKALYFSIEMLPREVLQRQCAIATKVPYFKIKNKNLDVGEWEKVVKWWSSRYENGDKAYEAYLEHRNFNTFHTMVSKNQLVPATVDIIYDSSLTLGRIKAEVDKRLAAGEEIGVVIIDYINKVKRVGGSGYGINHLDWQEQVAVSHALKTLAQDWRVPIVCPFQVDKDGEARFGKGILDSCDAAFILVAHKGDIPAITMKTSKMRAADDTEQFTSEMDWDTLRMGPKSVVVPDEAPKAKSGGVNSKTSSDISVQTNGVYDE